MAGSYLLSNFCLLLAITITILVIGSGVIGLVTAKTEITFWLIIFSWFILGSVLLLVSRVWEKRIDKTIGENNETS